MVGLSAAFMRIFLPLTLPAWILAKPDFGNELGIARAPWS